MQIPELIHSKKNVLNYISLYFIKMIIFECDSFVIWMGKNFARAGDWTRATLVDSSDSNHWANVDYV